MSIMAILQAIISYQLLTIILNLDRTVTDSSKVKSKLGAKKLVKSVKKIIPKLKKGLLALPGKEGKKTEHKASGKKSMAAGKGGRTAEFSASETSQSTVNARTPTGMTTTNTGASTMASVKPATSAMLAASATTSVKLATSAMTPSKPNASAGPGPILPTPSNMAAAYEQQLMAAAYGYGGTYGGYPYYPGMF